MAATREAFRGASALVTGAGGFIGSHLTRALIAAGARVWAAGRADVPGRRLADVAGRLTWVQMDLRDPASVERTLGRLQPLFVFHLAGITTARSSAVADRHLVSAAYETNLRGTINLLSVLHSSGPDVKRIVRAGGLEEYGDGPVPFFEDQRESPVSVYAASQLAATHVCRVLHRNTGLPVVTLRPALTYGPAQDSTFFIPALIECSLRDEMFEVRTPDHTRDLVYVDDVVEAFLRAAVAPECSGSVINIGSGCEYRVWDVAETIRRLTGSEAPIRAALEPHDGRPLARIVCDPGRALRMLDWQASVALEDGLRRTIAWSRHSGFNAARSEGH